MNFKNIILMLSLSLICTFVPVNVLSKDNNDKNGNTVYAGVVAEMNSVQRYSMNVAKASVDEKKVYEVALSTEEENDEFEKDIEEKDRKEEEEKERRRERNRKGLRRNRKKQN